MVLWQSVTNIIGGWPVVNKEMISMRAAKFENIYKDNTQAQRLVFMCVRDEIC